MNNTPHRLISFRMKVLLWVILASSVTGGHKASASMADWAYAREIELTHLGTVALTNQQVLVALDAAIPIGEGKMQADGGDIRFLGSDRQTLLP